MNKQQRNQWEQLVADCLQSAKKLWDTEQEASIIAANAYILKLERELQNIKGGKRIAAILKSKVSG